MKVSSTQDSIQSVAADAIVITYFQDDQLTGPLAEANKLLDGQVARMQESSQLSGKPRELRAVYSPTGFEAPLLLFVGLGPRDKFDSRAAFQACGAAAKRLADEPRTTVAFYVDGWNAKQIETGIIGGIAGCAGQDLYRKEKKLHSFESMLWSLGSTSGENADATIKAGTIIGESLNLTRKLVNEPPSSIYPESFAVAAKEVAKDAKLEIEVWDETRLAKENCGAMLAVGRGSSKPPRLVIVRHQGGKADEAPLALIGKGVTFDAGGLSIKPTDGMKTMKCDMGGAATVLGAMKAIAKLELPINAVGLMGLAENMLDGDCYKLGDVLTARNGKTIEVLNTDAEGRLVLADTLDVALQEKPAKMIDLATLTGACVVALGLDLAGLMTNDQDWCDEISASAEICGEGVWQLPMFASFGEEIRSEVADIKNVGAGRWGGAMTAAKFLEEFVGEDTPWTHIDIAGPAYASADHAHLAGGATGAMVRTLVEIARRWN